MPSLLRIATAWGRIGVLGFGGPPTHLRMLRDLVVVREGWIDETEFEDAVAACNLLPGPASTQMAIFTAWRVGGIRGGLLGGLAFITPGLIAILALSAVFLGNPPAWVLAAGAGAGAAVPAVAVHAGWGLTPSSWKRRVGLWSRLRWVTYLVGGGAGAVVLGPWLVVVLLACGVVEVAAQRGAPAQESPDPVPAVSRRQNLFDVVSVTAVLGALGALATTSAVALTALKVGALSYGGGFVIIPLMQADAIDVHHWMSQAEFLNAVALGQVTPGPVVHTVAVVGWAASGLTGALLAALVAFAPSFLFILVGARHFARIRSTSWVRAFLDGCGPTAIGAIFGSAVLLALSLTDPWQVGLCAVALAWLLATRHGVVSTLGLAALVGVLISTL